VATNTSTSTTTDSTSADVVALMSESTAIESNAIAALKDAYAKASAEHSHQGEVLANARHARSVAAVWMARIAYRAASHESIATSRYPYNITGAAKALGVNVTTLRPYAIAGAVLGKQDRAGLLSAPAQDDIAIVEKSFDDTTRAQQKEKRRLEGEKKAKLEAAAKELEARKAQDAQKGAEKGAEAPAQDQAPAPANGAQKGAEAPAQVPAAPAPKVQTLEEETLATAKQLVAQVKKLRADKGWGAVAPKVLAVLAEVFPALKS